MTEVHVEVSGEMDPPLLLNEKRQFPRLSDLPSYVPDPKQFFYTHKQNVRSWFVFFQTSNFKAPPSIPRLGKRIMRNIEYFQSNYVFIFLGLVIYCLITSPLILFAVAGTFYLGYQLNRRQQEKKLTIFGKELTIAEQYGLVALCSLPVYYLVGAHAAMFWVIGASVVVITIHAAVYNIEAISTREDDEFGLLQQV
ncbi:hypothetical protein NQ317_005787 [Molorchus minor]|uniref:PRA1 family protein n=1 Tax=Molorchus minor TaxID=1323400 RepID=A0ABQ9JGQ5_9CUCU|nr:hypothetical protein NQ317_005787 [Molorchus minor]